MRELCFLLGFITTFTGTLAAFAPAPLPRAPKYIQSVNPPFVGEWKCIWPSGGPPGESVEGYVHFRPNRTWLMRWCGSRWEGKWRLDGMYLYLENHLRDGWDEQRGTDYVDLNFDMLSGKTNLGGEFRLWHD